ncbi:MAG: DUF456 family protein [Planctomycetaceae bacterium]
MTYWTLVLIIQLLCAVLLVASLLQLPGNWGIVAVLAIWAATSGFQRGPGWTIVLVCVVIALLGEILEAVSGAAAVGRRQASRRAMLLSVILSLIGGLLCSLLIPIPVVGGLIGAIGGAAGGAFAGAWLGEAWVGSPSQRRNEIGRAAVKGRLAGMAARILAGVLIFLTQLMSFLQASPH